MRDGQVERCAGTSHLSQHFAVIVEIALGHACELIKVDAEEGPQTCIERAVRELVALGDLQQLVGLHGLVAHQPLVQLAQVHLGLVQVDRAAITRHQLVVHVLQHIQLVLGQLPRLRLNVLTEFSH